MPFVSIGTPDGVDAVRAIDRELSAKHMCYSRTFFPCEVPAHRRKDLPRGVNVTLVRGNRRFDLSWYLAVTDDGVDLARRGSILIPDFLFDDPVIAARGAHLLLRASLRLSGYRYLHGKPILKDDDVIRVSSLAADARERAA